MIKILLKLSAPMFTIDCWNIDDRFENFIYRHHTVRSLSIMADICPICGLPKDLCVCGEIGKEQQRIRIRLETRKWGKATTMVEGVNNKDTDLPSLTQKLKNFCACGGTAKNGQIMLQGDHREKVRQYLIKLGYPEQNVEIQ